MFEPPPPRSEASGTAEASSDRRASSGARKRARRAELGAPSTRRSGGPGGQRPAPRGEHRPRRSPFDRLRANGWHAWPRSGDRAASGPLREGSGCPGGAWKLRGGHEGPLSLALSPGVVPGERGCERGRFTSRDTGRDAAAHPAAVRPEPVEGRLDPERVSRVSSAFRVFRTTSASTSSPGGRGRPGTLTPRDLFRRHRPERSSSTGETRSSGPSQEPEPPCRNPLPPKPLALLACPAFPGTGGDHP